MTTATATKQLRKKYDKLEDLERFRLVLAAEERGDDGELIALRDSAPRGTYRILAYPYRGMLEGHQHVVTAAITDTLGLGCGLLLGRLRHALESAAGEGAAGDTALDAWEHAGQFATEIMAVEEGLRRFCERQGVTPEQVLAAPWPWKDTVAIIRQLAEGMLDMEREATACLALATGLDLDAELAAVNEAQATKIEESAAKYAALWQGLWELPQGSK